MSGVFDGATSFNQNISQWETANVVNMENLFRSATAFNQDISQWETQMFKQ